MAKSIVPAICPGRLRDGPVPETTQELIPVESVKRTLALLLWLPVKTILPSASAKSTRPVTMTFEPSAPGELTVRFEIVGVFDVGRETISKGRVLDRPEGETTVTVRAPSEALESIESRTVTEFPVETRLLIVTPFPGVTSTELTVAISVPLITKLPNVCPGTPMR